MNKILSFFITLFIFIYPLNSIASSTKSIGEKGDPNNIDRVINIKMFLINVHPFFLSLDNS